MERIVTEQLIDKFKAYLTSEERSAATVEKYVRDVKALAAFMRGLPITKEAVIGYKRHLQESYVARSVNSMLASINCLFSWLDRHDLKVKALKLQQQVFCPEEKELSRAEYARLCQTAKRRHNKRLDLILQTICGTGIRVSVYCKGAETKIAPLCGGARNSRRYDFCNKDRQARQPNQYLAGNESLMRGG